MSPAHCLQAHWGYEQFLPLQKPTIEAILQGQDSLTVLPTGGGKSVCFQLPAMLMPGIAVVVSPLLALMKDQVDSLTAMGIPAATLNSSQTQVQRREVIRNLGEGQYRLLYLSPEALATNATLELLDSLQISFFAIDEAHCISEWGHEYRPDYRALGRLRERWPDRGIHAFTATATPKVQEDICLSLNFREPQVWVGSVDRPNLCYRLMPRNDLKAQIKEVLERHAQEAGIIYCISRAQTEELAEHLRAEGVRAQAYHAGLNAETRQRAQEAFAREDVDVMTATIAFGMGINRTNLRFVIHAGLPRSLENWQQEAGRAGRDGLPSECVLLYSRADCMTWRNMQGEESAYQKQAMERIEEMYAFCRSLRCRHRQVVEHFGQSWEKEACGSCDVCLGELARIPDSTTLARKLLSGVARVKEGFGAWYVAAVLKGSSEERILQNGHQNLSTYGLLKQSTNREIVDQLGQLLAAGFLSKDEEHGMLRISPEGWEVLRGKVEVELLALPKRPSRKRRQEATVEGDASEFEQLRVWRRKVAAEAGVAPYVIVSDAVLKELLVVRPQNRSTLLSVKGVGERKAERYGSFFYNFFGGEIPDPVVAPPPSPTTAAARSREEALAAFARGATLEQVQLLTGRARGTVEGYFMAYLEQEIRTDLLPWVGADVVALVKEAVQGEERLKPIFEKLGGEVPYWQIRASLYLLGISLRPEGPRTAT